MDGEEKRSDHVIYIKAQRVNGLAPFSRLTRRGEPIRRGDLPASKQFYKKKKKKNEKQKKKKRNSNGRFNCRELYTSRLF